jgi:hypothetical protein
MFSSTSFKRLDVYLAGRVFTVVDRLYWLKNDVLFK